MVTYITYEYWNPLTEEIFYVGAGKRRRANFHLWEAKKYIECKDIPSNVNKHKISTIISILKQNRQPIVKIVFEGDRDAAFEHEKELIKRYGRRNLKTGPLANLTDGGYLGNFGMVMPEETKRMFSETRKGKNNPFYGRNWSDNEKEIMSIRKRGLHSGDKNPFYGKTHTEKSRTKISNSRQKEISEGKIYRHTSQHKKYLKEKYRRK